MSLVLLLRLVVLGTPFLLSCAHQLIATAQRCSSVVSIAAEEVIAQCLVLTLELDLAPSQPASGVSWCMTYIVVSEVEE